MAGLWLLCIVVYMTSYVHGADKDTNTFTDTASCNARCKGIHDSGCFDINGGFACRCASNYYSLPSQCKKECEDNQFWSLFTYGDCTTVEITDKLRGGEGLCQWMCSFRVRVWATVFTIILFASAITLLVFMLPGCITSCYTCIFLRKQKKRESEDAAIAAISGGGGGHMDPQGTIIKPGSAQGAMHPAYQHPLYAGWPYYTGAGGRW